MSFVNNTKNLKNKIYSTVSTHFGIKSPQYSYEDNMMFQVNVIETQKNTVIQHTLVIAPVNVTVATDCFVEVDKVFFIDKNAVLMRYQKLGSTANGYFQKLQGSIGIKSPYSIPLLQRGFLIEPNADILFKPFHIKYKNNKSDTVFSYENCACVSNQCACPDDVPSSYEILKIGAKEQVITLDSLNGSLKTSANFIQKLYIVPVAKDVNVFAK